MGALHPIEPVDLPIPDDVRPSQGWSKIMIEMAAYIGARDVLRLCERYGGQQVYFPTDTAKAPFMDVLGEAKAEHLCRVFRAARITLPTARYAIAQVKRAGVIAAVRAGSLTIGEAAARLHLRRDTVSQLVRQSTEGQDCKPVAVLCRPHDTRQIEMFPDHASGADA